jgi:hypothetical protein
MYLYNFLKIQRAQVRQGEKGRESGVYTTVCRFPAPHFRVRFQRSITKHSKF